MNDPLPDVQTDAASAAAAEPRSTPEASPFAESAPAPVRPPMGAARLARLNAAQAQLGFCVQHGDTPAIRRCDRCQARMCATCDFAFDHIHVCPACVANPTLPVSTRRIVQASLGLVLVGFATVVLGIIMAGLWELDERAAGGVFTGLILLPAVAGTVCACTAMSKRLGNNALLWTSTAWNLVMLGILGILMVVGMAKG